MNALATFAEKVWLAKSEREVAVAVMDSGRALFSAPAMGYYSFGESIGAEEIHYRGVTARFLDDYERTGRYCDPMLAHVQKTHAPAAASIGRLARLSEGYRDFSARHATVAQYLLAPILSNGVITGTMNFARNNDNNLFTRAHVRIAAAVSLHVSTRLASLASIDVSQRSWEHVLPRRHLDVAELAVRGFTVQQIGAALGISANTVKKHLKELYIRLEVASRAELATAFVRGPQSKTKKIDRGAPTTRSIGSTAAQMFEW